jgi:hypothetical protein
MHLEKELQYKVIIPLNNIYQSAYVIDNRNVSQKNEVLFRYY